MSDTNKFKVTVHHPTDQGRSWEMELEGSHTPAAIVSELIEDGHLPRTAEGYQVAVKGGTLLNMDQSLEAQKAKVAQDAHLNIIPATKGGASQTPEAVR